jgi:hypothetical protein
MSVTKNLLIRNNEYSNVRLTISGSQSGDSFIYYTEARGDRFYYNPIGSTASPNMEAATFQSFLSFTQSGATTHQYRLIPLLPNETVMVESKVLGINDNGSKGYVMKSFGAYRHNGTNIVAVGGSINYETKTDFTGASASYQISGTQSICLCFTGQTGETIDWDVYINYTKGFHDLTLQNDCNTPECKPVIIGPDNPAT